jgi:hypothetical protein
VCSSHQEAEQKNHRHWECTTHTDEKQVNCLFRISCLSSVFFFLSFFFLGFLMRWTTAPHCEKTAKNNAEIERSERIRNEHAGQIHRHTL